MREKERGFYTYKAKITEGHLPFQVQCNHQQRNMKRWNKKSKDKSKSHKAHNLYVNIKVVKSGTSICDCDCNFFYSFTVICEEIR